MGAYSAEQRRLRVQRFVAARTKRVWTKKVKYDVRKNFADSRIRVKVRVTSFIVCLSDCLFTNRAASSRKKMKRVSEMCRRPLTRHTA